MDDLIYASTAELARTIRTRKISSVEILRLHFERIEAVNPKLNAVVQLAVDEAYRIARAADADLARGQVWGPLHGVPITVKDGWETAGIISTGGTLGRASFVPAQDATVVKRLRSAGAIIVGKTNVPELSLTCETDNSVYGRTNNPYGPSLTPGGSGGGQAAIIAAGGSPLDIGCDAGGSIRLPSHFCGIAGIKPTTGLIPMTGYFPLPVGVKAQLTSAGPMARRVEDLILTLPVLRGVDWRDPMVLASPLGNPKAVNSNMLRGAFYTYNGICKPTRETIEIIRKAATFLSENGMSIEEARPAGIEQTHEIFFGLMGADGGSGVRRLLQQAGTREMCPLLKRRHEVLRGRELTTAEFCDLLAKWDTFRATMLSFFENFDLIICPVCAYPALPHGTTYDADYITAFSYTQTYNLTGWPGVVIRGGTSSEGLPIGIQIVAPPCREDIALRVAEFLEAGMGEWERPPL